MRFYWPEEVARKRPYHGEKELLASGCFEEHALDEIYLSGTCVVEAYDAFRKREEYVY